MKRAILSVIVPLAASAFAISGLTAPAQSAERDREFFRSVEGAWVGPGEIVAGKYKGTKFVCTFDGTTPSKKLGMTLDGGCRVGVFTQKMSATISSSGAAGYKGTFMDGASGSGLDIVSGNVVDGRKVVLAINRNELKGLMQARMADDNTMTVTISVRVEKTMVPVIGMNLKRVDATAVGSIARD
jgi:hypothetical protein